MKIKQTLLLLFVLFAGSLMAQTVTWFAGRPNENPNDSFNNSSCNAGLEFFNNPEGISWDNAGRLWITEKNKIRLLLNGQYHNRGGNLGTATSTFGYQNKRGILSAFYNPSGIVSDPNGVLYIADEGNHAIRKIEAFVNLSNGQLASTFAGADATGGTSETGIPGAVDASGYTARFYSPKGIVRDAAGNFYVADFDNFTIRKISSTGTVITLAGKAGVSGSKDSDDGKGTSATFAGPYGIAILDGQNLVITDRDNGTIRKVHMTSGNVTTIAGNAADNLVQVDGHLTNKARFYLPKGIAVVNGKIYVCDRSAIRKIDLNAQTVTLFAGSYSASGNNDGEGSSATFGDLSGMAYDGKISLYVTDHYYNVIKTVKINSLVPTVKFSASKTSNVIIDEIIKLKNESTTEVIPAFSSIKWTVTPATYSITSGGLTDMTKDLGIKFTATGFYNVTLDASNSYGSGTKTETKYISVSTVGIEQISENVTIGVYPNPSNGVFTLQSLYGNFPIQSYQVIDIAGKLIVSKTCSNSLSETFDVSHVQSGFYFIRVNTSVGSNTLKLQKI
ncbi:MAG: T9SS type A sorting domain-containing protein [Bacteroidia bacterium]